MKAEVPGVLNVVECRAEKMFGIESRSLKACHELLEVCFAYGLLCSFTGLLALVHPAVLKRVAAVESASAFVWSACTSFALCLR